jgi:hypothetical protein
MSIMTIVIVIFLAKRLDKFKAYIFLSKSIKYPS